MREGPSPIRHEGKHDPGLSSHGAGKMDHGGIDRNQEIRERQDRCGVGHVFEARSEIGNAEFRQPRCVVAAQVALDAHE